MKFLIISEAQGMIYWFWHLPWVLCEYMSDLELNVGPLRLFCIHFFWQSILKSPDINGWYFCHPSIGWYPWCNNQLQPLWADTGPYLITYGSFGNLWVWQNFTATKSMTCGVASVMFSPCAGIDTKFKSIILFKHWYNIFDNRSICILKYEGGTFHDDDVAFCWEVAFWSLVLSIFSYSIGDNIVVAVVDQKPKH